MVIEGLLGAERVFVRLRAADKAKLLADLAKRAAAALGLPVAAIAVPLAAREALGSTGVGAGIAVPHARIEGLAALTGFFARLDKPIAFAAIDGQPVDLVFLLLSPAQATGDHLAALAAMSRRLRDRAVADAIRASDDAAEIRALLTRG